MKSFSAKVAHRLMNGVAILLQGAALTAALTACSHVNDERIPASSVYLPFTQGQWNVYGLGGAGDYGIYSKALGLPANFPYAAMHETGYGGILLVMDYLGEPRAYSAACPVERSNAVLLTVGADGNGRPAALCAKCGSAYDVFSNYGTPLSGEAHDRKYALTRYTVSSRDGYPVVITE